MSFAGIKAVGLLALSLLALAFVFVLSRRARFNFPLGAEREQISLGFWAVGLLFLLLAGALFAKTAFVTMVTASDEGIYINAARNVALFGRYAWGQEGYFEDFSPHVSLGPTAVLPLALLYKLVGDGMFLTRAYAFGWLLLALAMLYAVYSRLCKGFQLFAALLLAVLFLHTSGVLSAVTTMNGESPTLFFLLCALFFLPVSQDTKRFRLGLFLTNVFLGLSIVTKTHTIANANVLPVSFLFALALSEFRPQPNLFKNLTLSLLGLGLPLIPWFLANLLFAGSSPTHYTVFNYSQFILFNVRGLGTVISRYGLINFLKIILLLAAATVSLRKLMNENRTSSHILTTYIISAVFLLWFFTCTDGHIIRYTAYPTLLLIPLSVSLLPQKVPSPRLRVFLSCFLILVLGLFRQEIRTIAVTISYDAKTRAPWISDQLRQRLHQTSGNPMVWVINVDDERYLSMLTKPPVFSLKKEMFQTEATKPMLSNPFLRPKAGDVLAVGVRREGLYERLLYLFTMIRVPDKPIKKFAITKQIPQEIVATLKDDLKPMGIDCNFWQETSVENQGTYVILESWPDNPTS